jgi:hypothetical protein
MVAVYRKPSKMGARKSLSFNGPFLAVVLVQLTVDFCISRFMMAPSSGESDMALRFLNAVGISIFGAGLIYLFLILINQLLLSTAWMQADFAVASFLACAIAYFREKHLWLLFQRTEAQRATPNIAN